MADAGGMMPWPIPDLGARVCFALEVDRFPHFVVRRGTLGTVVEVGDEYGVLPDDPPEGSEEWDGVVAWNIDVGGDPGEDLVEVEEMVPGARQGVRFSYDDFGAFSEPANGDCGHGWWSPDWGPYDPDDGDFRRWCRERAAVLQPVGPLAAVDLIANHLGGCESSSCPWAPGSWFTAGDERDGLRLSAHLVGFPPLVERFIAARLHGLGLLYGFRSAGY